MRDALKGLKKIAKYTEKTDAVVFVGLPFEYKGKLYNVAAAVSAGEILGLVPKTYLPNYNEFYEARHFTKGMEETVYVDIEDEQVPMGSKMLFVCDKMRELVIGAEICEDLWAAGPPSIAHALAGAPVMVQSFSQ